MEMNVGCQTDQLELSRDSSQRASGSSGKSLRLSRESSARGSGASRKTNSSQDNPFSRPTSSRSSAGSRKASVCRDSPSRSPGRLENYEVFSRDSSVRGSASSQKSDRLTPAHHNSPSLGRLSASNSRAERINLSPPTGVTKMDISESFQNADEITGRLQGYDVTSGNNFNRNSPGRFSDSRINDQPPNLARESPGRWSSGRARRRRTTEAKRSQKGSVSMFFSPQKEIYRQTAGKKTSRIAQSISFDP